MNKKKLIAGALALALAAGAGVLWHNRDSAKIDRALKRLIAGVSKKGADEGIVDAAAKAAQAAHCFTPYPTLKVSEISELLQTRSDIQAVVYQFRAMAQSIAITIDSKSLEMAPDRQTAAMLLTATAVVVAEGTQDALTRQFQVEWTKTKEGWLIERVISIEGIPPS